MADGAQTHITVLDGGVGHLIKQWGVVIPDLPYDQQFLAGCLALKAAPETVLRAHAAYIDCGCDVITTNNFVATQFSLDKVSKGSERTQYCQVSACHPSLLPAGLTSSGFWDVHAYSQHTAVVVMWCILCLAAYTRNWQRSKLGN
jgi:hypothetical protein